MPFILPIIKCAVITKEKFYAWKLKGNTDKNLIRISYLYDE
jgi:hypothetical protein